MRERIGELTGTWAGTGRGEYPTIDPFRYDETVVLEPLPGKPILAYTQRTRSPAGEPLHAESGFFRFVEGGEVELVLAQPTGIVEVHTGRMEGPRLDLQLVTMATTASAVDVTDVRRSWELTGDVLRYELHMAAVGQGLTFHLEAELHRR